MVLLRKSEDFSILPHSSSAKAGHDAATIAFSDVRSRTWDRCNIIRGGRLHEIRVTVGAFSSSASSLVGPGSRRRYACPFLQALV